MSNEYSFVEIPNNNKKKKIECIRPPPPYGIHTHTQQSPGIDLGAKSIHEYSILKSSLYTRVIECNIIYNIIYVILFCHIKRSLSAITAATGRNDVYLSQTEHDVGCKLQLWTLFVGCKTVYAERTRVEVPSDACASGCWTPYGWYVFCDSLANVYRVQPGAPEPEMVVATATDPVSAKRGNGSSGPGALVCPTKHGFVLYAVNQDNCLTVIMIIIIKIVIFTILLLVRECHVIKTFFRV